MVIAESDSVLASYHQTLAAFPMIKRFYERWVADPAFREALAADIEGTLARYSISVAPDDIRSLLSEEPVPPSPAVLAMWQIIHAKTKWVERFYREVAVPDDPRIRAWRNRQIARQLLDLGPYHTRSNIHSSLCVELTKGCSVGCWFCAVSAERLKGVFLHDDANAALWRDVLRVFQDRLGPAARSGFLYWASDPLDNPDYEQFCLDVFDVLGVFPPTTTALAMKDPSRTRALIALADAHECWLNRFSIVTLKLLDRVHAEFSAEELAQVECLPLNREAAFAYGNAGRFRERALKDPGLMQRQRDNLRWAPWYTGDPAYADTDDYPLATIGCVTGFLVNMVDRRVQLISPCTASDRWPLGYYVFGEGEFSSPDELASLLDRLIAEHMSPVVRPTDRLCFHDWLTFHPLSDGFELIGRFQQRATFSDESHGATLQMLGALVQRGNLTAGEIVTLVGREHDVGFHAVEFNLYRLLQAGVLDELAA